MQDNPTPNDNQDISELAKIIQELAKEIEELQEVNITPKP